MSTTRNTAHVTTVGTRDVHIEREFHASLDRVWAAYARIEQLAQWWGRGHHLDIERWEFRKGGHWRFVEHTEGQTHGFEGRFREIEPKQRIGQSFEWDGMPGHVAIETTTFTDLGNGRTKVTTDSLFHTTEERDAMLESGMESGLEQSYRALDELLAKSV